MDSFDHLIELSHEAKAAFTNFFDKKTSDSVDQAYMDFLKSQEICKVIEDKIKKVEMRKEGSGYGYDMCVYYMAKDWLTNYQFAALLVFTRKLAETLKQLREKQAEEKQKESLKQLIKQVIKETREEEVKSKTTQVKKRKTAHR